MSYILDALRRAEADRARERGQVPGLHTPPPAGGDAPPGAGPRRWLPWAGGGLLLLAGVAAGSWWAAGPPDAGSPPAPAHRAEPPAPPAAPPAPVAPAPQPEASGSPYLAPPPAPGAMVATAPAPAPVAEARIPRLAELPESLRRELPRLAISGTVYSDDPASRFVMINGEVMREGASLGADLVLERIGPRELLLRFKGQRYRQPV
ncbi:MAG: general secretion pathway protein GspB [Roseateles sp.]|uniref:general secretion pathway protein GspB n=1 Tax=Roseateles sp. TaxID=1971397 RepID=UPI0039EB0A53